MLKRLCLAVGIVVLLIWFAPGHSLAQGAVQWETWPVHPAPVQWYTLAQMYRFSEYHGLRDEDRDLFIRLGYRETRLGLDITGDYDAAGQPLSIGVMQWYGFGVWQSTPCFRELGWAGRWNSEADLYCGAWAIKQGLASHWRPWERVRWLVAIPPDPRPWLWGGPHPPQPNVKTDKTSRVPALLE